MPPSYTVPRAPDRRTGRDRSGSRRIDRGAVVARPADAERRVGPAVRLGPGPALDAVGAAWLAEDMDKVDLAAKLALVDAPWDPRVVAEANGQEIMVVRFEGAFPFHVHEDADDVFLVLGGRIKIDLEEPSGPRSVALGPGELMVVPAGVRHRPRAEAEAHVLLIEPRGLPNTGDPATASAKAPI